MNKKIIIISVILVLIAITFVVVLSLAKKEEGKQPITENQEQPTTITTTPVASEDTDTSDWETYRNDEFGFEFKHPNNWEVIKLPDSKAGFALKSSTYKPLVSGEVILSGEVYLSKIQNIKNLKIIDLIDTFNDASRFWPNKFNYKESVISSHDVVIFPFIEAEDGHKRKEVFIKLEKDVFTASYIYDIKDQDTEMIFDNIVNNFKFY